MLKNVEELDKKVYGLKNDSALHKSRDWTAYIGRWYSLYVRGIPEQYIQEAADTPLSARLQELRNIARLNSAIVHIMNYERIESREMVMDLLKAVLTSIETN